MKLPDFFIPIICGISPFALGWIALSIVVGIGGGWEASFRLFLLGLGLLSAILALGASVFFLPDWAAVTLVLFFAFFPWVGLLKYVVMKKLGGKLLLNVQQNNEPWSKTIRSGAYSIILGLPLFLFFILGIPTSLSNFVSSSKLFSWGILLISIGIFRVIEKIRCVQIREKGILYENGNLYRWSNIEGFTWKFAEDKLSLKLRKSLFNRNINLKIRSQFRPEIVAHLAQNVNNKAENIQPESLQAKSAG